MRMINLKNVWGKVMTAFKGTGHFKREALLNLLLPVLYFILAIAMVLIVLYLM
jgi:hypothetical protein